MRKGPAVAASALAIGAVAAPAAAQDPGPWTGFYAGGDMGVFMADNEWDVADSDALNPGGGEAGFGRIHESETLDDTSAAAGVRAGYMHQLGSIVLGAEAGIAAAKAEETHSFDGAEGSSVHTESHYYATVTALVGFASGNLLCFVDGGGAFTDLEHTYNDQGFTNLASETEKQSTGWTVGGGVEYLLTPNVSIRASYEYMSFSSDGKAQGLGESDRFDVDTNFGSATVGVNYRF